MKFSLYICILVQLFLLPQQARGMRWLSRSHEYEDIFEILGKSDVDGLKTLIKRDPACLEEINGLKETPLHVAIRKNDCASVQHLLECEINCFTLDVNLRTPLHTVCDLNYRCEGGCWQIFGYHIWWCYCYAMQLGQEAILKKLCEKLVEDKLNLRDIDGNTSLHYAIEHKNKRLVKELLRHGPNLSLRNSIGFAPLHLAAKNEDFQLCALLIQSKADVNEPISDSSDGESVVEMPLHIACRKNNYDLVLLFLKHGAQVDLKDAGGDTPLHIACIVGSLQLANEVISRKAQIDAPNELGETPLFIACKKEHRDLCDLLIEHETNINYLNLNQETPLHVAAKVNNTAICRLLLTQKVQCNVKARDYDGRSALYNAIMNSNKDVCDLLISNNAEVDTVDRNGKGLLHCSVDFQDASFCQYLIDLEIDINAEDKNGATPFMLACKKESKEVRDVFFRCKKLELKHADKLLKTSLFYACEAGNIPLCKKLINLGLNHKDKAKDHSTLLHCASKQRNKEMMTWVMSILGNLDDQNDAGETALHTACKEGTLVTVKTLLEQRVFSVDGATESGKTPLHFASKRNHTDMIALLDRYSSSINSKDTKGRTPLHHACSKGNEDAVILLLDLGASTGITSNSGDTPCMLAKEKGHMNIVALLQNGRVPNLSDKFGAHSVPPPLKKAPPSYNRSPSMSKSSTSYDSVSSEHSKYSPVKHEKQSYTATSSTQGTLSSSTDDDVSDLVDE